MQETTLVGVGGCCGFSRRPLWLRQEATVVRARDCSDLKFKKIKEDLVILY
jgi:hypothetical protein